MTVINEDNTLPTRAQALLQGFLASAEFDARAEIQVQEDESVTLAVTGPDACHLVGPRGQFLDALQHLLLLMVHHTRDQRPRLTVDADGYRARRTETLQRFAQRTGRAGHGQWPGGRHRSPQPHGAPHRPHGA